MASVEKELNKIITKEGFIDKDEGEYIYASLTQPPIKIINKNNSEDELDFTVECPNCHKEVNYGDDLKMLSGYLYCDEVCRLKLLSENDYLKRKYQ